MGVVDEGRGTAGVPGHELHPAGGCAQAGQQRQDGLDRRPTGEHEARGGQEIVGLERADQVDGEAMAAAQQLELELHAAGGRGAADQTECPRRGAVVENPLAAIDREPGEVVRTRGCRR